jgi:hypothetical protein
MQILKKIALMTAVGIICVNKAATLLPSSRDAEKHVIHPGMPTKEEMAV